MKIQSDELEKWVRMNKIAFWNINPLGKNKALFSYNENDATVESAIVSMQNALDCLPSGDYDFNGRSSQNGTRGTVSVTFSVGSITSNSQSQNSSNMNVMNNEQLIQERISQALALQEKDFEIRERQRQHNELVAKFDRLYNAVKQMEIDFWEHLDGLDGVKDGEIKTIFKDGISSVVNQGTKRVVDKFAGFS